MENNKLYIVWSEGDSYGYYGEVNAVFDSLEKARAFIYEGPEWKHYEVKELVLNNNQVGILPWHDFFVEKPESKKEVLWLMHDIIYDVGYYEEDDYGRSIVFIETGIYYENEWEDCKKDGIYWMEIPAAPEKVAILNKLER